MGESRFEHVSRVFWTKLQHVCRSSVVLVRAVSACVTDTSINRADQRSLFFLFGRCETCVNILIVALHMCLMYNWTWSSSSHISAFTCLAFLTGQILSGPHSDQAQSDPLMWFSDLIKPSNWLLMDYLAVCNGLHMSYDFNVFYFI